MASRRAYEDTTVSADRSQAEIRALLQRYGARQFGIMEAPGTALIGFVAHGRTVKIEVPLPDHAAEAWTKAGKLYRPGTAQSRSLHEQEERRTWRAARAWIFAQLEAVESGIKTFEEAFLADTVLPSGERFAGWAAPQLDQAVETGRMPARLSLGSETMKALIDGE